MASSGGGQAQSPAPVGSGPAVLRADGLWLDDFAEGMTFRSGTYEVTTAEVKEFASRFDPQLFHLDEEQAVGTLFGGLAASGWHTAAMTMRLFVAAFPIATGIIGSDMTLKWPTPTRPGDVLHLEITVDSVTWSASRPDRGTVVVSYETLNQNAEVRQRATGRIVAWRRPTSSA
jgi:acyl dehydratase